MNRVKEWRQLRRKLRRCNDDDRVDLSAALEALEEAMTERERAQVREEHPSGGDDDA